MILFDHLDVWVVWEAVWANWGEVGGLPPWSVDVGFECSCGRHNGCVVYMGGGWECLDRRLLLWREELLTAVPRIFIVNFEYAVLDYTRDLHMSQSFCCYCRIIKVTFVIFVTPVIHSIINPVSYIVMPIHIIVYATSYYCTWTFVYNAMHNSKLYRM